MKKLFIFLFSTLCGIFSPLNVNAKIDTVLVADFLFTPAHFTICYGDTIRFVWVSGVHNIHIVAPWDSVSNDLQGLGDVFEYVPPAPATYSYVCDYHSMMTGTFTVMNPLVVNLGPDTVLCGGNITLNAGNQGAAYLWSTGETTQTIVVSVTDTLYVNVSNSCQVVSDTIVIYVLQIPSANAGNDATICLGDSVTIGGSPSASGGTMPYTYAWSPPLGLNSTTDANPVASPSVTTSYVIALQDSNGCAIVYDTVLVYVSNGPSIVTSSTPATCGIFDGTATVNATGGMLPYSYFWNTGDTSQTVTGLFSGTYSVCVTDGYGCTVCDTVSVVSTTTYLQTIFSGGNGQDGNMFDVTALSTIQIVSMDGNIDDAASGGAGGNIHIYYKAGTHVGFEANPSAWTLAGTAFVNPIASGIPTPIPIPLNIIISAGQTYAFYVTGDNSGCDVDYTNGTNFGNPAATDANLQILEGIGIAYPFGTKYPSTGPPGSRIWNGRIHYCTGPVGGQNILSTQINIYPNPSEGIFTVSGLSSHSKINVMNLFGKVVFEKEATSSDEVIRLNVPAGLYIYDINDKSGNIITGKIVVR